LIWRLAMPGPRYIEVIYRHHVPSQLRKKSKHRFSYTERAPALFFTCQEAR
jgi:hypothetical protein